jgi:hypothetical protein
MVPEHTSVKLVAHCTAQRLRAATDDGGFLLPCAGEGVPVGYHRQRFIEAGLMTEDGQKTEYTLRMEVVAANLGLKDSIHIGINVMLTSCTRWDSIMVLVQVTSLPCYCLLCAVVILLAFVVLTTRLSSMGIIAARCTYRTLGTSSTRSMCPQRCTELPSCHESMRCGGVWQAADEK